MKPQFYRASALSPLFQNLRRTAFLIVLLICSDFIKAPVVAQQAPKPPEGFMAGQVTRTSFPREPGLLFYLSGNKGFIADFAAGGQVLPNYLKDVTIIPVEPVVVKEGELRHLNTPEQL